MRSDGQIKAIKLVSRSPNGVTTEAARQRFEALKKEYRVCPAEDATTLPPLTTSVLSSIDPSYYTIDRALACEHHSARLLHQHTGHGLPCCATTR
jgi:hypothetical protein